MNTPPCHDHCAEPDLTIRDVQSQMEDNLRRWYPDEPASVMIPRAFQKVIEEYTEWDNASYSEDAEECADIVIALCSYCSQAGIDLQSEIERKLAIVSARTDQSERDRARGITAPEPPTLRPGATIRAKHDTKSINGLNIPKDQLLRVLNVAETMITTRIGEHGEGLVATVQPGDFEVVG